MKANMSNIKFKIGSHNHPIQAKGNWSPAQGTHDTPLAGPYLRKLTESSSYGNLSVQASKVSREFNSLTNADSHKLDQKSSREIGKFS